MKIRTQSVHTGVNIDKTFNSVITPIYPTSTFYFDAIGKNKGFDYTRSGNPTRAALEANIAALEGGLNCSATCTGMSAITAVMFFLKPGDHTNQRAVNVNTADEVPDAGDLRDVLFSVLAEVLAVGREGEAVREMAARCGHLYCWESARHPRATAARAQE